MKVKHELQVPPEGMDTKTLRGIFFVQKHIKDGGSTKQRIAMGFDRYQLKKYLKNLFNFNK